MQSEKQLVREMQKGNAAAFAAFVDAYGGRIHALSRRYCRTEADAEDLTQEIFVAVSRSIGSFRGDSALSTYVYRIAMNHCLKVSKRMAPESVSLDDLPLADERHNPEQHAAQQELAREVNAALSGLSEGHREVVVLHELHGLTYAECARVLEIPVGTVKSRLFHAFGKLRERLSGYVRGDETPPAAAIAVSNAAGTTTWQGTTGGTTPTALNGGGKGGSR